ncbi:MAG: hypothetical protein LBQ49_02445, partial [Rickettsiales bacterium]|nr:hypothetical protein [Rickettsiales bacterium]
MKKILIFFTAIFPMALRADEAVDDIMKRYNASLGKAQTYCNGLTAKIDSVKTMAGIGIGAGAVGTIGGGVATVTGVMKAQNDKQIVDKAGEAEGGKLNEALYNKWKANNKAQKWTLEELRDIAFTMLAKLNEKSQQLGNIRTAGGFVAGVGGAAGATTSFIGIKTLDDLIVEMNACDSYVKEIDKQATELRMTAPDDPTLSKMNEIVKNCKGMSSKNIADVKNNMKMAGIIA